MSELDASPKHWPPLGLPVGSVRALLTLFVVAVVVVNVSKNRTLDLFWTETLLIALAHYFTARRFVSLPPSLMKRFQDEGLIEKDTNPLWLPRHCIRFIILAAFGWLTWNLHTQGRLKVDETQAVSMLLIVAAYVAGSTIRAIGSWVGNKTKSPPSSAWGDFKAIVVLLAMGIAGFPELFGMPEFFPDYAHRIALGLMLFYIGSR
jgi:hypothetical protein